MKPPPLRAQDKVAIVAPAGPFDRASFEAGLNLVAERYKPVFDEGLFSQARYLAGPDARRLEELQGALSEPSIRAIFCARGGYGAMRILPQLKLPTTPKLLVGFSDVTALHAWLQQSGRVSVHAPVLTQLGRQPAPVAERLFRMLESPAPSEPLTGAKTLVPGTVEGRLVGGNLRMLGALLGTPFLPPLDGAVLLLEDVGERPYKLDRLWTQLTLAGVFRRVRGLALGTFTDCEEKDASYGSLEVLQDLARATGLPCAAGFPIGHGELNYPVPLGVRVRLDAGAGALHFLEGACE